MDEKELQRLYDAMSGKFDIGDFGSFKSKMQTSDDRKRFYDAIGSEGFDLGDYPTYEKRLSGGATQNKGMTAFLQATRPKPVKETYTIPSPKEFNESIPSYARGNQAVSTSAVLPGVRESAQDFEDNRAEKKAANDLVKNKAKEITAKRSKRTVEQVQKDIDNGDLVLTTDENGEKVYGRQPGMAERFVKSLFGNLFNTANAARIKNAQINGTPEELRDVMEDVAKKNKELNDKEWDLSALPMGAMLPETPQSGTPVAKPDFWGEAAGVVGNMAPDVLLAAGTGGYGNAVKMATIGGKMYAGSYSNTAQELYHKGKQEAMREGMNENDASIAAAHAAAKNADIAAVPDAVLNTLFFSGKLHSAPAKNFVDALKGTVKDGLKVGGLAMGTSALKSGAEAAQGYNTDKWIDDMFESGGGMAVMDAMFHVLPIIKTLPKAVQSATKELAVDPVVKPFVENYLKTVPEGIEIKKDLDAYENATKDLRGVVSEEKMASIGGRMQKRVNRINDINQLKAETLELEAKKEKLPESLHQEIDNAIKEKDGQIKSLQKEIGNIDGEIEKINKSEGSGLDKEVDELTGKKIIPEGITVEPPKEVPEPITVSAEFEPTPQTGKGEGDWSRDVESTAKALDETEKNNPSKINELVKIDGYDVYELDTNSKIAREYHEAKMQSENTRLPEQKKLVKAVEDLLGKPSENKPINESTKNTIQEAEESKPEEVVGETAPETKSGEEPTKDREFEKMTSNIPNGGEVKKYLSGETITKYQPETELRNNQEIIAQELDKALKHGVDTIEKAKEIFGDDYVEKTLNYIEKENIPIENKALLYVSLENEMAKRILAEPDNAGLKKLEDLVRIKSQAFLRSNSLAINMGRLRKFAEAGFDIKEVTDKFFSPKELEQKGEVEKLVQADADTIQKEYERQEVGGMTPEIEKKIQEGVEAEINKIYEKLPKDKKRGVDKAIEALEKFQKRLRGKTYDATIGVPVAIIDVGITAIKLALKAGVKLADAIEHGIEKIKEKYGKEWDKEDVFRKDMEDLFSEKEKEINPQEFIKKSLINQGYGKEVTVTVNKLNEKGKKIIGKDGKPEKEKQKKIILDWKKLAGEEGSVDKISENVSKSLATLSMSEAEINAMSKSFIEEYNNLRASVIEKGLNEIAARNKTSVTPDQKSAAKKLAEMYNYGLFDKNLSEYETVLAKTIGVDKLNEKNLVGAIELGKSIADLFNSRFQGKKLTESQMRSAIQVIEDKMRYILHNEAQQHGSTPLMLADIARTYMDLTQRMTLNSIKQAVENPLSGKLESFFSDIAYSEGGLNKQARKLGKDIYKEMVLEKGTNFGDVSSTFVNKGNLEMQLDKTSDSKLVQGILSTVIGRTTLDAVDSAYKAKITQQKFTYNLLKILQQDRMVNGKVEKGMSKQEAKNYVAEKLTGQSFKDAQTTAKEIIDRINSGAKEKIFNNSPLFVDRLANDIVTAALVNGEKISADQVTAAYNAAYKAAGRGLGHVANNYISKGIGNVSGQLESSINEALKNKEYNKAAGLTVASIFFRNIANPFVGGGTNWVVLKAEKSGLGLLSGLGSMMMKGAKIDLMNESGMKNLEKALYENMKIKDKMIRGAVGGATTVLAALIMNGITTTDEYRKWRAKNTWAAKYLDLITPEIILATMAKESGKTYQYLEQLFNKNDNFDKGKQAMKAATAYTKGDGKANALTGSLLGSTFGAPVPWRLVRDGDQIWTGLSGGEPYKVNNNKPETFWQGYFKGGMLDYLGVAPKSTGAVKEEGSFKIYEKDGTKVRLSTEKEIEKVNEDADKIFNEYIKKAKNNKGWGINKYGEITTDVDKIEKSGIYNILSEKEKNDLESRLKKSAKEKAKNNIKFK